ncbi:MAG: hypothetical protein IKU25_05030 [Clostridia bacterium]|nr:hypothetical protein [Clostridia bacterium]
MFGIKFSDITWSIYQIIIIVILIAMVPFIAYVLPLDKLLDGMVRGMPIFELWTDIFSTYKQEMDFSNIMYVYTRAFFDAAIMGICITTAKGLVSVKGRFQILPTFLGLCVGIWVQLLLDMQKTTAFLIYGLLLVIGISLMIKGALPKFKIFSFVTVMEIIVDSLLATILCGDAIALRMFRSGLLPFGKMFMVNLIAMVSMLLGMFAWKFLARMKEGSKIF